MAKLSVSINDDLARDMRRLAEGNISAFVARAVRREIDRTKLASFVVELEYSLGPATEREKAEAVDAFDKASPKSATKSQEKSASASRTKRSTPAKSSRRS